MSDKPNRTRGLGRGLSALMADVEPSPQESSGQTRRPDTKIAIEKIFPNPDQPRRIFTQDQLEELAESIRAKGVIQPLIVRPRPNHEGHYEIVAGERRWRAAQLAQLHELPVVIREFDDIEVLEIAIIENIQREDLNPIEEGAGYKQLMERFGHTQEKLASALGKSRSHIANLVRLLQLPDDVQAELRKGTLSAGHARALITSDSPSELAKRVIASGLSVRETERLVKKAAEGEAPDRPKTPKAPKGQEKDADTRALEADLSATLKMKVSVDHRAGQDGGTITISYRDLDQLDDLCRLLSGF